MRVCHLALALSSEQAFSILWSATIESFNSSGADMERAIDLNNLEQIGQARSAIRDLARDWFEEGLPNGIVSRRRDADAYAFTALARAAAEYLYPQYVIEVEETADPTKPNIDIRRKRDQV